MLSNNNFKILQEFISASYFLSFITAYKQLLAYDKQLLDTY